MSEEGVEEGRRELVQGLEVVRSRFRVPPSPGKMSDAISSHVRSQMPSCEQRSHLAAASPAVCATSQGPSKETTT